MIQSQAGTSSQPAMKLDETLAQIVSEKLDIDLKEITLETDLRNYQFDSLMVMELIMEIEEVYDIEVSNQDLALIEQCPTVARIQEYLDQRYQAVLVKIILQVLSLDQGVDLSPSVRLIEDLGATPVQLVELVLACQRDFHVTVRPEHAKNVLTVGGLADLRLIRRQQRV
jgi:acyl carrier protein